MSPDVTAAIVFFGLFGGSLFMAIRHAYHVGYEDGIAFERWHRNGLTPQILLQDIKHSPRSIRV
jgi:hypothetical protein